MKTERELFEAWLKEEDPFGGNDNNPDVIWAKKFMFEAWQASAQREGYKLVPVKPTPKMIDSTWNHQEHIEGMSHNTRNEFIYKTMIGVSE